MPLFCYHSFCKDLTILLWLAFTYKKFGKVTNHSQSLDWEYKCKDKVWELICLCIPKQLFRQHAASIYGFVRLFVSFVIFVKKNLCVRLLGYIVGASPPLCVRSIGNTVGAYPPRVCPFIG